jgi:quinolinate synthase
VYRLSSDSIGCSLAEAAESEEYTHYLQEAGHTPNSLHVVYINTSLRTKAVAHSLVPTITCTSSNVVQTVLQAFAQVRGCRWLVHACALVSATHTHACDRVMHALSSPLTVPLSLSLPPCTSSRSQVPDATVWYGPDTYMGRNLSQMFQQLSQLPDEDVQQLHPAHTAASIRALLPRLKHYASGTCVVHHIFGGETCELVRQVCGCSCGCGCGCMWCECQRHGRARGVQPLLSQSLLSQSLHAAADGSCRQARRHRSARTRLAPLPTPHRRTATRT